MREIVVDTETTGLDPHEGHRLVEIGCVELFNHVPTGRTLHKYINPERDVPSEAVAIHGLNQKFLSDKPVFAQVFAEFLEFTTDAALVIHNADFDMKFLNYELKTVGHGGLKNKVTDTLAMVRKRFPGSPASLDALCRRFGIDNSGRELHGALLDSQLLAEVYLELMGGRQHGLGLEAEKKSRADTSVSVLAERQKTIRTPRLHLPSTEELRAHAALLKQLNDPIWQHHAQDMAQTAPSEP
jgi:DNA polymerase-3 subunit epsilon